MPYDKTVLPTGATVITETVDTVRSVALGLWFAVGSRNEPQDVAGMSHFLEHMMFKGTPTRDAAEISESFDRIGAELNAFTSKEYTCYYSRFVDEHLGSAFEVLADMVSHPLLAEDAVLSEREVVLEEISRQEDTPDDRVHELFASTLWPDHPLGRPVLGLAETVGTFDPAISREYKDSRYHTGDLVVAASGRVEHEALVALVREMLDIPERAAVPRPEHPAGVESRLGLISRDTEQAHLTWGVEGLPAGHDDRFVLSVLDQILGGGMSSRLFQEIREKRGLAYAVFSYSAMYRDTGSFNVYCGTRPRNAVQAVGIVKDEAAKIADEGPSEEELHRAKESLKGRLVLGLESTRARMVRVGKSQVTHGELLGIDEIVERVDAVDGAAVRAVAARLFDGPAVLAVVGPFEESDLSGLVEV